jgi:chloride channel 7
MHHPGRSSLQRYDAEDIFLFAILGIFGGLLGGLFNFVLMKLNYWRKAHIGPWGYRRFSEVMLIMLITSLCVVFVPTQFPCTPAANLVNHIPHMTDIAKCAELETNKSSANAIPTGYCLSTPVEDLCLNSPNGIDDDRLEELYDLKNLRNALCDNDREYNELESLMQGSGHQAVALLFEEGAGNVFGYSSLFLFLFVYFCLAIIAAGSSIPAGLVIPMLTIGGTMGRIWGLVVNDWIKRADGKRPIDPGAWAQVGAAAFWCGSGRVTVTIAVIVLETTGEYSYAPPPRFPQ